jgi:hypothetical protein
MDVHGAAVPVRVRVAGENGHAAAQRGIEGIVRRLVVVMVVPVVVTVRPVLVLHKLDFVAVIVGAVTECEIDPEAVRFR